MKINSGGGFLGSDGRRKAVAFGEIFLMISFSFAIAFIFSESIGVVSAFPWGIPPIYKGSGGGLTSGAPAQIAETTAENVITQSGGPTIVEGFGAGNTFSTKLAGGDSVWTTSAAQLGTDTNFVTNAQSGLSISYDSGQYTVFKGSEVIGSADSFNGAAGLAESHAAGSGAGTLAKTTVVDAGSKVTPASGSLQSLIQGNAFGTGGFGANIGGALLSGAIWGATAGAIAYGIAKFLGVNDKSAEGIGLGVGAGTFVGTTLYFYGQNVIASGGALTGPGAVGGGFLFTPLSSFIIGGAIAGIIIYSTYTEEKKELVRFECFPWEPPTGGLKCEECNNDELPCSEYRCKSLGQACEIINPGTLEERCIWVGKGDATAPKINPWDEPLLEGLKYIPDQAISPPNRGFKIVDEEGDECLPAFLNFEFGVIADEPAQCKVAFFASDNYENMSNDYFGGNNLFVEEHRQALKVPTPFAEDEIANDLTIGSDGTYQMWVRCIDANGNGKDSAEVVFSFCVDQGPDLTPPRIVGTIINDGEPVAFGANELAGFELYTNEPADCKWSRQDKEYEFMENTMQCATETYQINSQLNYVCQTTLTGIVDSELNNFYFRCQDYSTAEGGPNKMENSYEFSVRGTEPLTIKEVGPTEDQTGSSDVVVVNLTVETAHGADEGVSTCYYSTTPGQFDVPMEGDTHLHHQEIDLTGGKYDFYFRCIDAGANSVDGNVSFNVIIDKSAPLITRVFRDGNQLKLITDEAAQCFYSLSNCNYNIEEAANAFSYVNPVNQDVHVTGWDESNTYYVKCQDFRGRQPNPDQCQLIVKASEL